MPTGHDAATCRCITCRRSRESAEARAARISSPTAAHEREEVLRPMTTGELILAIALVKERGAEIQVISSDLKEFFLDGESWQALQVMNALSRAGFYDPDVDGILACDRAIAALEADIRRHGLR